MDDMGVEKLVALKPDPFDGSDDFAYNHFLSSGERDYCVFGIDGSFLNTFVVGSGENDFGVIRMDLPAMAAGGNGYRYQIAYGTQYIPYRSSYVFELKIRIYMIENNHTFIGFHDDSSLIRTVAGEPYPFPYGVYFHIISGQLTAHYKIGNTRNVIGTNTPFTVVADTPYVFRMLNDMTTNTTTFKILNEDMSQVLWTDSIVHLYSTNSTFCPGICTRVINATETQLPFAELDYMGHGFTNGYYRTFGRLP
jgi:hypothetical protein